MADPRIRDISPPLTPDIAVWPGDTPMTREVLVDIDAGAHLDLSTLHATVHLGAHTDAPRHYRRGTPDIASRDLSIYYGPCQVVHVDIPRGERILPAHVTVPITAPRVLFRTGTFPDPNAWNEDFAALSPELVTWLATELDVLLVELDTPSVDLMHDKALHSHNAIADHDLAILEGVVLDGIEPGVYTLVALPLRLVGFDASPVRAVLIG